LRLSDDDRDTLFRLAGSAPPGAGRVPMLIRPSVYRLLDRMSDLPAVVLSAKSDVLAWNPLATALLGDLSALPPAQRNLIWQRFLGPSPNQDAESAADCVGCLRSVQARYPDDPDLNRLVADLRAGSPRFDELWRKGRSGRLRSGSVTIKHPELGPLVLDCDVLLVPDGDQTVLVYSAEPGTPSASALELLRVTGLERFAYRMVPEIDPTRPPSTTRS
jgi:hypothetical protein